MDNFPSKVITVDSNFEQLKSEYEKLWESNDTECGDYVRRRNVIK